MKNRSKLVAASAFMAVLVVAVLFTACDKGSKDQVKKEIFSGYAQKGPFVVGSSVTIIELDESLDQTGKTYLTTISDDFGSFEQKNIELVSNYVELKADGYYLLEVGGISAAPITLYALVDIKDVISANVNVLTHMEKPRVEYLIKQGTSFTDAKQQAQREILAVFSFNPSQTSSEALNLTSDAALIAISCILHSNRCIPGEVAELMANISTDIKTDGILDNTLLRKKLVDYATTLTTSPHLDGDESTYLQLIRKNLETKYPSITIPNFESYIQAFIDANK